MTETDKLYRAQLYMKQLADGIDPLTGRELPDDTVLNQVRLSRCFYYVTLANIISQAAAESNVRKLSYSRISEWLVREGYLRSELKNDKQFKRPTAKGEEIGIVCDRRTGSMGISYEVVLYTESAQRFVVENMGKILEEPAAVPEVPEIVREARRGDSIQEMAERHGCSADEIVRQLEAFSE